MFGVIGIAVAMVAIGGSVAWDGLSKSPLLFVLWWGVCGWMTIAALLLAIFDMLIVFRAGRRAKQDLARQITGLDRSDGSKQSNVDPGTKDD